MEKELYCLRETRTFHVKFLSLQFTQNPAEIDEFPNQEYSSTFERFVFKTFLGSINDFILAQYGVGEVGTNIFHQQKWR